MALGSVAALKNWMFAACSPASGRTASSGPKPRRVRLELETLEDRALLDAASVLASLQDVNIRALAQDLFDLGRSLTRVDMMAIFHEVADLRSSLATRILHDARIDKSSSPPSTKGLTVEDQLLCWELGVPYPNGTAKGTVDPRTLKTILDLADYFDPGGSPNFIRIGDIAGHSPKGDHGAGRAVDISQSVNGELFGGRYNLFDPADRAYAVLELIDNWSHTIPYSDHLAIVGGIEGTIAGAIQTGKTVKIRTEKAHGFAVGQVVTIAGVGAAGYNGTFVITSTPTQKTFTYTDPKRLVAALVGGTAFARDKTIQAIFDAEGGVYVPTGSAHKKPAYKFVDGNGKTFIVALADPGDRNHIHINIPDDKKTLPPKVVNAAELNDLQTLVKNSSDLVMPLYVENLSSKVIGYNLANKHFKGHDLLPKGQLAAGDPGEQLNTLVDKWFRGKDLPVARDFQPPTGHIWPYQLAVGPLFGLGGPSNLDVHQGSVHDCYFTAALAETALRAPKSVKKMFINNGDGTFTVRFFVNGSSTYVTVNRQLPVDSGRLVFANSGAWGKSPLASSPGNVLWVALVEKAYAQLAEEGWSRAPFSKPVNSYWSLNAGSSVQALEQITGSKYATGVYWINDVVISWMIYDFQKGALVMLGSKADTSGSDIIARHAYYVTGYNASTKKFTVANTRNNGPRDPLTGDLKPLTGHEIARWFDEYDVAYV